MEARAVRGGQILRLRIDKFDFGLGHDDPEWKDSRKHLRVSILSY